MNLPKSFLDLVNNLLILPGVGEKTAERYAYSLYEKEADEVDNLVTALVEFKKNMKECEICGCITDNDIDEGRDHIQKVLRKDTFWGRWWSMYTNPSNQWSGGQIAIMASRGSFG